MQLRRKSNAFDCCATQGRRSRTENKLNEKYPSAMGKKKLRKFPIKRDLFRFVRDIVFAFSLYRLCFFSCLQTRIFVLCRLPSISAACHPPRPGIIQISTDSTVCLGKVNQVWYLEG